MRRFWLGLIVGLLHCVTAVAAPIPVRSGEHETFTRIVLDIGQPTPWKITDVEGGFELRFEGKEATFDLSEAFTRISRERISAITPLGNNLGLRIVTSCDCDVSSDQSQNNLIVLDFSQRAQTTTRPPQATRPDMPPVPRSAAVSLPIVFEEGKKTPEPMLGMALPLRQENLPVAKTDPKGFEPLKDTEKRILQQIAVAATQGMLTTNPDLRDTVARIVEEPAHVSIPENAQQPEAKEQSAGGGCFDTSALQVEKWPYTGRLQTDLAAGRAALYNEIDALNEDAAIDLAHTYILYGFTAEARQIASLLEGASSDAEKAMKLSDLIDFIDSSSTQEGQSFLPCRSAQNIWTIAASNEGSRIDIASPLELVKEFSALSDELKDIIFPRLYGHALHSGASEVALALKQQIAHRTEDESQTAETGHRETDHQSPQTHSNELDDPALAKEGASDHIISSMTEKVEKKEKTAAALIELADSYVTENRDTNIGDKLIEAKVLALAQNGDFAAAFSGLHEISDKRMVAGVEGKIIEMLAQAPDDLAFLGTTLQLSAAQVMDFSDANALAFAARLLNLGLIDLAFDILRNRDVAPENTEMRLLLARIALGQSKPRAAELVLEGIYTPDAALIRADAKTLSGDYDLAYELFKSVESEGDAEKAAWRAGNWSAVRDSTNPSLSHLSEIAENQENPAPTPNEGAAPSLQGVKASLDSSERLRATLADALSGFPQSN